MVSLRGLYFPSGHHNALFYLHWQHYSEYTDWDSINTRIPGGLFQWDPFSVRTHGMSVYKESDYSIYKILMKLDLYEQTMFF